MGRPESWQPDPTGRWRLRWWDGHAWTHHVGSGTHTGLDRLTDQEVDLPLEPESVSAPDAADVASLPAPRAPDRTGAEQQVAAAPVRLHGVEHLALHRTRSVLEELRLPDEQVHAIVVGRPEQVIVALDERLVVIKIGMAAGANGSARVTSFRYEDVTGILVSTGLVIGTLTVETATTEATPGDVRAIHGLWTAKDADNPWKLPNVVPLSKATLVEFADDIDLIRAFAHQAQHPPPVAVRPFPTPASRSTVGIVAQLKLLVELHESGALGDDQMTEAMERVLAADDARATHPPAARSES